MAKKNSYGEAKNKKDHMALGQGGRFESLVNKLEKQKNPPRNPAAVAAAAGRKKYGAEKFAKMAAAGKKK